MSAAEVYQKFSASFADALQTESNMLKTVSIDNETSIEESFGQIVQTFIDGFGPSKFVDIDDFVLPREEESRSILSSFAHNLSEVITNYLCTSNRGDSNFRAERDLWSLIEKMCKYDVLGKIEDDNNLPSPMKSTLSPTSTIPDCINSAFLKDVILKKGEVLQQWLEQCASDEITFPSIPVENFEFDSIFDELRIPNNNGDLFSGQNDCRNYEALLRSVWQCIRCGQLQQAQQLAFDYRIYWLAGLLRGVDNIYYSELENSMVTRIGNIRQPFWSLSCWKLADDLSQSKMDLSDISKLELSIYASMSNNVHAQIGSYSSSTWHDRTWAIVKATHARNILRVLMDFRQMKLRASEHYLTVQRDVIEAEKELFGYLEKTVGDVSLGSCSEVFRKNPPPSPDNVEGLLVNLQTVFMRGYHGLEAYIRYQVPRFLTVEEKYDGKIALFRVMIHVLIWVKIAPNGFADDIRSLVEANIFCEVLERYIDCLVHMEQYHLVGTYCMFLSRPRRVKKYSEMLMVAQTKVVDGHLSDEILKILFDNAHELFPEDVCAIFCLVVKQTCSVGNISYFSNDIKSHAAELRSSNFETVSRDDQLRILSLQWLAFNDTHLEMVLHCNTVITCALEEWGFKKMNFVASVLQTFSQRLHKPVDTTDTSLELFEVSRVKFQFWHRLLKVVENIHVWFSQREECQQSIAHAYKSRSGKGVASLQILGKDVLNMIEECIKFEDGNTCDGFVDMWYRSKDASFSQVEDMLDQLVNAHQNDSTDVVSGRNIFSQTLERSRELCSILCAEKLIPTFRLDKIEEYLGKVAGMQFSCKNLLYSAELVLQDCNSLLDNLIYADKFSKHCLCSLVSSYFEVTSFAILQFHLPY